MTTQSGVPPGPKVPNVDPVVVTTDAGWLACSRRASDPQLPDAAEQDADRLSCYEQWFVSVDQGDPRPGPDTPAPGGRLVKKSKSGP